MEAKNKKEVKENQITELKALETKYSEEILTYNKEQDLLLKKYEKETKKQEDSMKERQIKEMDLLYKEFEDAYSKKIRKYSKEVLDLKATEDKLVKLQR